MSTKVFFWFGLLFLFWLFAFLFISKCILNKEYTYNPGLWFAPLWSLCKPDGYIWKLVAAD